MTQTPEPVCTGPEWRKALRRSRLRIAVNQILLRRKIAAEERKKGLRPNPEPANQDTVNILLGSELL